MVDVYLFVVYILICLLQNSSTYWKGDAAAESLQRIYGISFPDSKQVGEEGWGERRDGVRGGMG